MAANPVELIGGMTNTDGVPKADIVAWAKARVPQVMESPAEVNDTVMGVQLVIYVKSLTAYFVLDTSDTTSPDDGATILVSDDGKRFKIVSAIPLPTALSLGGVFSKTAVTNQWLKSLGTDGVFTSTQPAASDLSNGLTGTGLVVLATAPLIVGGTHDGLTSLGIRSTATAFDVKFASAETLSANRTLSLVMGNANRSVTLAGDLAYGGAFTMSGAYAFTGTLTGATGVTFPTTGTLATLAGAETLTNKGLNATNNTITNLTTAMFAANVVDTDGTLAANSDTRLASQKATKTYLDQIIAAADAMVFKGVIDCSANPNYPAADRGWTYKVSVAGKIGGASGITVDVGDTLLCLTDSTASGNQATVGTAWNIVQANLVGAVTGPASSTSGNVATFNGTGGTVIQDSGKALPSGTIVGTSDSQALTGKTYNGLTITSTTGSLTIAAGKTLTLSNTLTFTGTDASSVAFGAGGTVIYNGGALGTPSGGTATNLTGLPISTGLTGAGTGVLTALAVNVGSAGAPVLFNGAGGTPSSLTLTNATGLPTAGLVNNAVTLGKMAQVATARFLGRTTASTGDVEALTATQATALLDVMVADGAKGLTPAASSGDGAAGKFLKADGTWAVPAGGGGGGGMTNDERQNFLQAAIYQSKLFGDYRRGVHLFATGFHAATDALRGIVAGSSSNYTAVPTSALISYAVNTSTAGTTPSYANSGGTGDRETGSVVVVSQDSTNTFRAADNLQNTVDGSIASSSAAANVFNSNFTVDGTHWVQYDFGSGQLKVITEVKWYQSTTDSHGTWKWQGSVSDGTTWVDIGSSFTLGGSTTQTITSMSANTTGYRYYRLIGVSGTANGDPFIQEVEFKIDNYSAPSGNDLTLVTTLQTASSAVSNGRVLIEWDDTASVTLNTDLTAEVTCNGGSNWTSASLSFAGTGQGGRKIAESVDAACTSGTSFAARIKTANGKLVPLYGVTLQVH